MTRPDGEHRPGGSASEELLDEIRPTSFAIAYRMLGSVAEAEDIVQEALLRVHRALQEGERIDSPRAFVATITTRLAIDELRSARVRRERYVGEWLPEPILTDSRDDPAQHAEIADSLSMAMLVLLETLSPEQRDELARRFFAAVTDGDLAGLEALLAHDVVLTGDGGGKVPALGRPLQGRNRVARALANWVRLGARIPGATLRQVEVNGMPGALLLDGDGRLVGVWELEIGGGHIQAVNSVVNPDKLAHLGPLADVKALLKASAAAGRAGAGDQTTPGDVTSSDTTPR
jgi:RNA polymerase sigma factor (sigma-70 family)